MRNRRFAEFVAVVLAALLLAGCGTEEAERFPEEETEAVAEKDSEREEDAGPKEEDVQGEEPEFDGESENSEVLEELDRYMEEKDITGLFDAFQECLEEHPELSDELKERKTKYLGQISAVYDEMIAEADGMMAASNWEGATEKLNEIVLLQNEKFSELDSYLEIVSGRQVYYGEYRRMQEPLDLLDIKPFDSGDGCFYRDDSDRENSNYNNYFFYIDRYGNTYKKYYELQVGKTNEKGEIPYVIFDSEQKYDIFRAKYVSHDEMKEDKVFHIEVYGDDTLLYRSESFTSYQEPMEIELGITGYRMIKFVAVREDHNLPLAEKIPSVGLVEAGFYHSVMPEFEYYTP